MKKIWINILPIRAHSFLKNKMVFAGLKKEEERKAVIDYIATFK